MTNQPDPQHDFWSTPSAPEPARAETTFPGYPAASNPGQPAAPYAPPSETFPGAGRYLPEGQGLNPYGYSLPEHPDATTVLVLGGLGTICAVTAPFAWYLGSKARREMAEQPGRWAPSTGLNVGWVLGILVTLLVLLGVVAMIAMVALGLALFAV